MKNELKIFLASPRGFCAGVERAIEIVEKTIEKYGSPVYVRHEIVHNKQVVENLKKKGTIFVEELSEVKDLSRPVIFSAHGVPKTVPEEAKIKNLFYIDATCPLVSKVHRESEQLHKKGYEKILELTGVGFRASLKGKQLNLQLGFSHDINFDIPEGINVAVEKQTTVKITGSDKQLVGMVVSKIKSFRPPEPYKGKGIKEKGQYILRKEGKKK